MWFKHLVQFWVQSIRIKGEMLILNVINGFAYTL